MTKARQLITVSTLLILSAATTAFCMEDVSRVPTSCSQQTIYGPDDDPESPPQSQTQTSLYDETGLVTALIIEDSSDPDESYRIEIQYVKDDMGNPVMVTIPTEETYAFEIKNSYAQEGQENDVLKNAVITDVLVDGISMLEEWEANLDPASGMSTGASYVLQSLFSCLRYYTGYRDMELRFADTQMLYRYDESGRVVYQADILPSMLRTTTTRYLQDGVLNMTVTRVYHSEGNIDTATETVETDNRHCMVSLGVETDTEDVQTNETIYFQYDKRIEENTGRMYLNGTIRETSGSSESMHLPHSLRYYLNNAGDVVQEELKSDVMTRITDYDEEGRIIRYEMDYATSDLKTITTYTY